EQELRAAARAAELAAVLDDANARDVAHRQVTATEVAARALLAPVGLALDAAPVLLRAAAEDARRRSGRLDGLRHVAEALTAEQQTVLAAQQEADVSEQDREDLRRSLEHLTMRRAVAVAAVTAARGATQELPEVQARCALLRSALGEARGLQIALDRLAGLREEHLLARETQVSLREKENELREGRLVTMVAELADRLVDGAPCEVCGSTLHPDPYEGDGDGVTRDDEDRARLQAEQAARVVADLEVQVAAATATAEGHRARLATAGLQQHDITELEREGQVAVERAAALADQAAGLVAALAEQEGCEVNHAEGVVRAERLAGQSGSAQRRVADAQHRAQGQQALLHGELEGAPDLATARSRVTTLAQACETVLRAAEQADRTGADAVRSAEQALAGVQAAGFADVAAAAAARRSPAWRVEAEQQRRSHDDRCAAVASALADPELQVALDPAADPPAAARRVAAADEVLAEAGGALASARGRVAELEQLVPELLSAEQALVPLELEAGQARRLADLCAGAGGNALKMTLTSFVLAARLEQVAAAASGRLLRMSQGRYSLVHTDGAAKGGARTGLGLLARDSWTGQDRDTSTLSGGETFLASLALALGLADVVQAEAGGTRIEALFVDEGFGTLDEDTLDEVMDVLDGLREGGRLVGLVSHVAELRARIPAQVRVIKTRRGSDLELLGC
ncbi:MAG: SMC family ATPase, partial [Frankiales bacterium]|nr:SMC family ATPase [Frankiales bacterium]